MYVQLPPGQQKVADIFIAGLTVLNENLLVTCCTPLKSVKSCISAALLVNVLSFSDWQLILTVIGSVFGAIIIVTTSTLSVMAHK